MGWSWPQRTQRRKGAGLEGGVLHADWGPGRPSSESPQALRWATAPSTMPSGEPPGPEPASPGALPSSTVHSRTPSTTRYQTLVPCSGHRGTGRSTRQAAAHPRGRPWGRGLAQPLQSRLEIWDQECRQSRTRNKELSATAELSAAEAGQAAPGDRQSQPRGLPKNLALPLRRVQGAPSRAASA